jgi:thymidine kinase
MSSAEASGLMCGTVTLFIGPMGSGKTARAISEGTREALAGGKVLVIKHAVDTRPPATTGRTPSPPPPAAVEGFIKPRQVLVSSRDGRSLTAAVYTGDLGSVKVPPGTTLVIIDEGQFFTTGLTEFCMAQQLLGRSVIVTALNSYADAKRTAWPAILELIPKATRIKSLTAICVRCHGVAECTRRLDPSATRDGPVVHIGGDESYVATCAGCYTLPISEEVLQRRQGIFDWLRTDNV